MNAHLLPSVLLPHSLLFLKLVGDGPLPADVVRDGDVVHDGSKAARAVKSNVSFAADDCRAQHSVVRK